MFEVAEFFYPHFKPGKPEDGSRDFIRCVAEKDVVGSDDDSRSLAFVQFLPAETACKFVSETGKPCPVENAFEERGHSGPPGRIEDDEVFAPTHVLLKRFEIRLKFLDRAIAVPKDGVESHFPQIHPPYLVPRFLRAVLILIC